MPGISAFAPPLDATGNSVKAQKAIAFISERLGLNVYAAQRVQTDCTTARKTPQEATVH